MQKKSKRRISYRKQYTVCGNSSALTEEASQFLTNLIVQSLLKKTEEKSDNPKIISKEKENLENNFN